MEAALDALASGKAASISEAARTHHVGRSALSRRFNAISTSRPQHHESRQLLSNQQEIELIKHIDRLTRRCLPPPPRIVAAIAEKLCGKMPSKNWCSRFVSRHRDVLNAKFLNTIDLSRHQSDSRANYEHYFTNLREKLDEYRIVTSNIYNMDEKGFLMGQLQKTKRIFTRAAYDKGTLLGAGQDGSREWITVIATICADGTPIAPALIYKAQSSELQDDWLEAFRADEHDCWFTSSPNGWTNNERAFEWLTGLFERKTKDKAGRSWRLLFVDGHGSHLTLDFIEWCHRHRVLLALYPPHATHRLQPLDVGLFSPLANYYSQGLEDFIRQSEGFTTMKKRDFFLIFWPAFEKAFTKINIESAWSKVGVQPFNPRAVLCKLRPEASADTTPPGTERASFSPPSDFNSPSKARHYRKLMTRSRGLDGDKKQRLIDRMGEKFMALSARNTLQEITVQSLYKDLHRLRQPHKPRRKTFAEQLRADEGAGSLLFSPSKVQKVLHRAAAAVAEKDQLAADKAIQSEERARERLCKEIEAEQRRIDKKKAAERRRQEASDRRAAAQAAREAKKALREAEEAQKAAAKVSKAPNHLVKAVPTIVLQIDEVVQHPKVPPRVTTKGRIITQPSRFNT